MDTSDHLLVGNRRGGGKLTPYSRRWLSLKIIRNSRSSQHWIYQYLTGVRVIGPLKSQWTGEKLTVASKRQAKAKNWNSYHPICLSTTVANE